MNSFAQSLAALSIIPAILLKVTVLLVAAWLAHFALTHRNPRWRVLLWRVVLVGLVILPPAELLLPRLSVPVTVPMVVPIPTLPSPEAAPSVLAATEPSGAERLAVPPSKQAPPRVAARISVNAWLKVHMMALLAVSWGLVALVFLIRMFFAHLRLGRVLRLTQPAPEWACRLAGDVAGKMAYGGRLDLRRLDAACSPFAAGWRRPVVVLPAPMLAPDYAASLPAILAHELNHLRSRDQVWMVAARLVAALLWFHPLAWKLAAAHDGACESVCDAVAADLAGGAQEYSSTLARAFLELVVDTPAPLGAPMIRPSEITRRIRRLRLGLPAAALARRWVIGSSCLGAMALLALGALKLVQAEPVPEQSNLKTRTLTFPADRALGTLFTRQAAAERDNQLFFVPGLNRGSQPAPTEWRKWKPAQGVVIVPAGVEVLLDASLMLDRTRQIPNSTHLADIDQNANRLAALEKLPPDALQGLFMGGIQWGRAADMPWSHGRITYTAVYPNDLNENEFRTITRLSGLRYLSFSYLGASGEFPVELLPELGRLGALKELNLFNRNDDKTMETVVRKALPQCQVSFRRYQIVAISTFLHDLTEPPERTLTFPDDRSLGVVRWRDAGPQERWPTGWVNTVAAMGTVKIPAGQSVGLFIEGAVGQDLSPLVKLDPNALQFLSIESKFMLDQDLEHLKHLTGLKGLSLMGCDINGAGFEHLASLTELEELHLGNHTDPLSDASMAHLGKLKTLRWLRLGGTGISDAGMTHLRPLTKLKNLTLNRTLITDRSLEVIKGFGQLEELRLDQTKITDRGLENLAVLTLLMNLNIADSGITDAGLEHLKGLTAIENLCIDSNPITDRGVAVLAGLKNLEKLSAMETKITNTGWAGLKGLGKLDTLSVSRLDDAGVETLRILPTLRWLQIIRAAVTPASVKTFGKMKGFKKLTISGDAIDAKLVAELKAVLPGCEVIDPLSADARQLAMQKPWRNTFDAVYRLPEGEVLKRIAPPFIPQRMEYCKAYDHGRSSITEGPVMMVFRAMPAIENWSKQYGGEVDLADLLGSVAGLSRFEYEAPAELLKFKAPGDWVVRYGTKTEERLPALEKILETQMGLSLRFEKRKVERETLVARGRYAPHPLPNVKRRDEIQLYVDQVNPDSGFGGASGRPLRELLEGIGSRLRCWVIDETESSNVQVSWHENESGYEKIAGDPAKMEKLLKNLEAQTEIKFTREKRQVEVWFVERR